MNLASVSRLVFSELTLARLARMVWFARSVASRARATILILPSLTSLSANGTTDQPMSICPVMVWVKVAGTPPVGTGFALDWALA